VSADPWPIRPRCLWCRDPIRVDARRDSLYCSQSHRQAAWRFNTASSPTRSTRRVSIDYASPRSARRFAYADPPYPGQARRHYADHADYGGEVDHQELVSRLTSCYDGWALSTSAAALRDVLGVCPADVRVAAWLRGARSGLSYLPLTSWEPVIYRGARRQVSPSSVRRLDSLVYVSRPRLTEATRVIGAKPAAFNRWLFELLGLLPGDELVDLFPGSGGVARSWGTYAAAWRDASS